ERYMKILNSASWLLPISLIFTACTASRDGTAPAPSNEPGAAVVVEAAAEAAIVAAAVTEAPTGFDNKTNGFCTQAQMDDARAVLGGMEGPADGLGPCYNLTSCASCHQNPFSQDGTGGQVNELRAGHFNGTSFVAPPGGSLIHDRAVDAGLQEHIPAGNEVV